MRWLSLCLCKRDVRSSRILKSLWLLEILKYCFALDHRRCKSRAVWRHYPHVWSSTARILPLPSLFLFSTPSSVSLTCDVTERTRGTSFKLYITSHLFSVGKIFKCILTENRGCGVNVYLIFNF